MGLETSKRARRPRGRVAVAGVAGTLLVMSSISAGDPRGKTEKRPRVVQPAPGPAEKSAFPMIIPETKEHLLFRPGRFRLESGAVIFGRMLPGEAKQLPGSVRVRVYAEGDWVLKLAPEAPLENLDSDGAPVSSSRISWRSEQSPGFVPFQDRQPAIVARGEATGPVGRLVLVDLRMLLEDRDDLGRYECRLHLLLETDPGAGKRAASGSPVLRISNKR